MKPEIWFDIDDVLVDTSAQIHRVMLSRTGQDIPVDTWPSMLFSQFYGLGQDRVEEMREWWRDDQVLELAQPFVGALEAVRAVHEQGHRVGLITARAWHPQALAKTEDMIAKYALPVEQVIMLAFGQSKRDLLADRASAIVGFIDDSAQHVKEVGTLGIATALVRRPWNKDVSHEGGELSGAHEFPQWLASQSRLVLPLPRRPR